MARLALWMCVTLLTAISALRRSALSSEPADPPADPPADAPHIEKPSIDSIVRSIPDYLIRKVVRKVKSINVTLKVARLGAPMTFMTCPECRREIIWTPAKLNLSKSPLYDLAEGETVKPPESCTMVSNARDLLNEDAGERINQLGRPVLRFNGAVVKGFEPHVGNRSDILVVNDFVPCHWMRTQTGPPHQVRHVVSTNHVHTDEMHTCIEYVLQHFARVKFFAVDFEPLTKELTRVTRFIAALDPRIQELRSQLPPAEDAEVALNSKDTDSISSGSWITSGMLGLMVLLKNCQRVHHFGFVDVENCREHYWDVHKEGRCSRDTVHDLTLEHVLLAMMSNRSNFTHEGIMAGVPATSGNQSIFANTY